MNYTTAERNRAILFIGSGNTDFKNALFYEALENFKWINIGRQNGKATQVELTYSGKDLLRRLLKSSK